MKVFNTRLIKRGGIWFLTLGRLNFSFSVSRRLNSCFVQEVISPFDRLQALARAEGYGVRTIDHDNYR